MTVWRMKMRDGVHGYDMWPLCRENGVAAITYDGVSHLDLRPYSRKNYPPGWEKVGGKGNLSQFAWDVRGRDTIYVGDSKTQEVVGIGHAIAPLGELAYRFEADSPISTPSGARWCHLIDVDWDRTFRGFPYKDRAPQSTLLKLKLDEVESFDHASRLEEHRALGLTEAQAEDVLLLETSYSRYTPGAVKEIFRRHVTLSNEFKVWLMQNFNLPVSQERNHIDATFETSGMRFLIEFKIAYHADTKRAIREALGQILEYNYYPPRASHDHWLLILDTAPCDQDISFLGALTNRFGLPLNVGWKVGSEFKFNKTFEHLMMKPPLG